MLSLASTDPWAKGGVMVRESLAPRAPRGALTFIPESGMHMFAQLVCGSQVNGSADKQLTVYVPQPPPPPTFWCKITRPGTCIVEPYYDPTAELARYSCGFNNPNFDVEIYSGSERPACSIF